MGLDDDDIDLFGVPSTDKELSSLLDDLPPKRRSEPTPTAPAPRTIRSLAENERITVETERATLEAPEGYAATYGDPGDYPWQKLGYCYRALTIRRQALERAFFLSRDVIEAQRALPEFEAQLGRAAHDAASAGKLSLPREALLEVRSAMESLSALTTTRDEIRRDAQRQGALASAQREAANASLDPVATAEHRCLMALEGAERRLEAAKLASAAAEKRHREALESADPKAEDYKSDLAEAQRAHANEARATRDAALAYADVRRRAILQAGRIAEAESAVEGARMEERRADREHRRREDEALRGLRDAYAKLGSLVYEDGIGKEELTTPFAVVYGRRDKIRVLEARVASLRQLANAVNEDALVQGKIAFGLLLGLVFLVLVAIAVFG